ncbi:uncharacterized protein PSFLO_01447 [Pseudozyma flocculosa]|uniref:Mediator of RNA polymerase II transcription subunit 5 n=1 Tax=Pseudozyma flocculosa TaxID=84751 RepID=A0A5C3EWK5_9BASI|nr:uncharacterized protein PSFLO_01447 [Pseudozyma flocculosa]
MAADTDYASKVASLLSQCLARRIEPSKFLAFAHQAKRRSSPPADDPDPLTAVLVSRLLSSSVVDPLLSDYLRQAIYGATAQSGTSSDEGPICNALDVTLTLLAHSWSQVRAGQRIEALLSVLECVSEIVGQGFMMLFSTPGAFRPDSVAFRQKIAATFRQPQQQAAAEDRPDAEPAASQSAPIDEHQAALGYLSINMLLVQLASTAKVASPHNLLAPRIGMALLTHSALPLLSGLQEGLCSVQTAGEPSSTFSSQAAAAGASVRQIVELIETTLSTLNPTWEAEISLLKELGGQLDKLSRLFDSSSGGGALDGTLAKMLGEGGALVSGKQPAWDHFIDVAALSQAGEQAQQHPSTQPEQAAPSVTLDQSLTAFYFELLSAAAEACSIVVETPSALKGSAETYSTLWRNALCGLMPEVLAQIEQWLDSGCAIALKGERCMPPHARVESALKALLITSSDKLEGCESTGTAAAAATHDGDARMDNMLDSVVGAETPTHQPVRAWLLRSLIESALARPEAITDEFPGGHKLAEEVQSLSQSLRMDAQLEGLDIASSLENKLASDDLTELLDKVCRDPGVHHAFSQQLLQQLHYWLEAQDYDSVSRCCKALLANLPALDTLTLYFDPAELATMLASLLDRGDVGQASDEPSTLCNILLLLQLVCQRYSVAADAVVPSDNRDSFFARFLRASSVVYRLADLAPDERSLVGRWISALFDNEGISDELTRDSSPRALLRLAPTLFSQSINACNSGIIDLETLRGGLSYFLQDLLSYTLPAAMRWLLQEVQRVPLLPLLSRSSTSEEVLLSSGLGRDATSRTVHLAVVQLILGSETCPPAVRHTVAADFERFLAQPDLARSLKGTDGFDLGSLKSGMEGFGMTSGGLAKASVWLRTQLGSLATSRLLLTVEPASSLQQWGAEAAASGVLQQMGANRSAESIQALSMLLALASTGDAKAIPYASVIPLLAVLQHVDLGAVEDKESVVAVAQVVGLSMVLLRSLASVQTTRVTDMEAMVDAGEPAVPLSTQSPTPASRIVDQLASLVMLKLARLSQSRGDLCKAFVDALRNAKAEVEEPALQPVLRVLETVAPLVVGQVSQPASSRTAVTAS